MAPANEDTTNRADGLKAFLCRYLEKKSDLDALVNYVGQLLAEVSAPAYEKEVDRELRLLEDALTERSAVTYEKKNTSRRFKSDFEQALTAWLTDFYDRPGMPHVSFKLVELSPYRVTLKVSVDYLAKKQCVACGCRCGNSMS